MQENSLLKEERVMKFENSKLLQMKSHTLIPGGCHTYSKGDDQYPVVAPGFIVRGAGSHVWDLDGNEFIEYGMGLRSVTLGHAYKPVVEAAYRQMQVGSNFTRPSPIEVECAEAVLDLIPGSEMVKFGKNGSDVTTAAVKLARAYTGRDMVAICGDQPFFSVDDWFIGTTQIPAGVPDSIRKITVKFNYNDIDSVKEVFRQNGQGIACLVMEAATAVDPKDNFLGEVKKICEENGALFILDEMITGFRWDLGGAQKYYDVEPDLSTFGKAMGNGFSVSALVGKREYMELGGLHHKKERVFLLSYTHGAESHCLAAALETIATYKRKNVIKRIWEQGEKLAAGIRKIVSELGLEGKFAVLGKPCNLIYATRDQDGNPSQAYRTLFLQETIKRGLLLPSMVVSYSHSDEDIRCTVDAVGESLWVYRKALSEGIEKYLEGRPVKPVYRRFN